MAAPNPLLLAPQRDADQLGSPSVLGSGPLARLVFFTSSPPLHLV